jgi:P pilus assembly chaperone PapD
MAEGSKRSGRNASLVRLGMLVLMTAALGWVTSGHAVAETGMKVWPTRVDIDIYPGGQATQMVSIRNYGDEPAVVRAYCMDFVRNEEGEIAFLEAGHQSYSASMWISLADWEVMVGAEEVADVEVTLQAPESVEPGGHYAALFFETVTSTTESGVAIAARIPCLFYVTTPSTDGIAVSAEADIASVSMPGVVESGPVDLEISVANSGNVHVTVAAKALMDDSWGTHSEVDLGQVTVLPDNQGVMSASWDEAPFLGSVRTKLVIGYYDEEGELVNKERTQRFLVVPWRLLTGLVCAACLLAVAGRLLVSRYRLRVERR